MKYLFLISFLSALSYRCNLGEISETHFLYKEDNVNEVKWLEKFEYCRAKGDVSVYRDAGQGKCEYSRGLCYWDGQSCLNTNRDFDNFEECVNLLLNNALVDGLDNGRLQQPAEQPAQQSVVIKTTTTTTRAKRQTSTPIVSRDIPLGNYLFNYIYFFII